MAILMLTVPVLAQEAATNAVIEAQRQAELDVNKTLWWAAGCFGGWVGVLVAYVVEPSPPVATLIGKPPEYVAIYTQEYTRHAKSLQTKYAFNGCLVAAGVEAVLYILYVALLTSAVSS